MCGEDCINFCPRLVLCFNIKEDIADETFGKGIGCILPPYTCDIQQKCLAYIIRMGMLLLPDEIFN